MTVTLTHHVDNRSLKDLQKLEVMELSESHTSELTDEDLVKMTASTDEEKDSYEDDATNVTDKLTLK
ncbi:hypothetical protein T07_6882 [Trichinella nelsoni]|uniref:Uncharacterized protein n=1 Tax=Trichinella nelsoni TaxID=6336 RepID=A0A0V0S9U8_9BILA|nr:hypothetical protein T07_6882 [Trichinella nelsoni]